jgi:hypothetical protein
MERRGLEKTVVNQTGWTLKVGFHQVCKVAHLNIGWQTLHISKPRTRHWRVLDRTIICTRGGGSGTSTARRTLQCNALAPTDANQEGFWLAV